MFAYGAGPCRPVDLVTGPGNIYVVAAKRLLKGVVGIDSEAGPTEIAILADDTADPVHVAADLISQAEHDPLAASVLVTDVRRLAGEVEAELASRCRSPGTSSGSAPRSVAASPRSCWSTTSSRGSPWSTATPRSTSRSRPTTPRRWAGRVRNAGAIFVGAFAPVSLGDYVAGSNHVLPTAGCACHSSGLSVQSFLQGRARRRVHRRRAARGRRPRDDPRRRRGPARSRRRDRGSVSRTAGLDDFPFGTSCVASSRTAPPSSTCPSASTSTRTPTARARRWSADVAAAVASVTGTLNRYPDRDVHRAPGRAGRLPRPRRGPGAGVGGQRRPTRSCCRSCRRSAARAGSRSPSRRRTRCTRSTPATRAPAGSCGHRERRLLPRRGARRSP